MCQQLIPNFNQISTVLHHQVHWDYSQHPVHTPPTPPQPGHSWSFSVSPALGSHAQSRDEGWLLRFVQFALRLSTMAELDSHRAVLAAQHTPCIRNFPWTQIAQTPLLHLQTLPHSQPSSNTELINWELATDTKESSISPQQGGICSILLFQRSDQRSACAQERHLDRSAGI